MSPELPRSLVDYVLASRVALALASARDDNPLLLVNPAFTALTGHAPDDVVGRNCRMLQRDAANAEPRARLREFLTHPRQANVRTPIVNFRKDGTPFVNLLYMSRLKSQDGVHDYILASQFDVSRSQGELLAEYDAALGRTLERMTPVAEDAGILIEGTLLTIANTAATVANAKLMLAGLDLDHHG